MVIAVTYNKETGEIGQHFGHADFFKLYEIENGKIIEQAVVQPFGQGHAAVLMTMQDYSVTLVICKSIGAEAMEGLQEMGISVCPGVEGLADDAIEAFLSGSLQIQLAPTCDCGGDCGSSCGGGCGGCCH